MSTKKEKKSQYRNPLRFRSEYLEELEALPDIKLSSDTSIRLVIGSGQTSKKPPPTGLNKTLLDLLKKIQQHDDQKIFATPVTEKIAPDYFLVIKKAMDISTIRSKINHNEYSTIKQFRDDVYLMIQNAMIYNSQKSIYYKKAKDMMKFFTNQYKQIRSRLRSFDPIQNIPNSVARSSSIGSSNNSHLITSVPIPTINAPLYSDHTRVNEPFFLQGNQNRSSQIWKTRPVPTIPLEQQKPILNAEIELLLHNSKLRPALYQLSQQYGPEVLADAIAHFCHCDSSTAFEILQNSNISFETNENSEENDQQYDYQGTSIMRSEIPFSAMQELQSECPDIHFIAQPLQQDNMTYIGENNEEISSQHNSQQISEEEQSTIRIMNFYANTLRYWPENNNNNISQKVQDKVSDLLKPRILNTKETDLFLKNEHPLILHHVVTSLINYLHHIGQ